MQNLEMRSFGNIGPTIIRIRIGIGILRVVIVTTAETVTTTVSNKESRTIMAEDSGASRRTMKLFVRLKERLTRRASNVGGIKDNPHTRRVFMITTSTTPTASKLHRV